MQDYPRGNIMINDKITRIQETISQVKKSIRRGLIEATHGGAPLRDFEYLIHHIETKNGKEEIHHCYLYDHIANLFQQGHITIKDGKVSLDGKTIKEGTFHVIVGLEQTQEVCYSDTEATAAGIRPKRLTSGMTRKQKAKEWNK